MTADELRAIRERLNQRRALLNGAGEYPTMQTSAGRLAWELIEEGVKADIDVEALLAEVERLQRIVGKLNPCPTCRTFNLVKRDDSPELPNRHTGPALAEKIRAYNGGRKG